MWGESSRADLGHRPIESHSEPPDGHGAAVAAAEKVLAGVPVPGEDAQLLGQGIGQDRHGAACICLGIALDEALTAYLGYRLADNHAARGGVGIADPQRGALAVA